VNISMQLVHKNPNSALSNSDPGLEPKDSSIDLRV